MEVDSTLAATPPLDIAAAIVMIFQKEHVTPEKIAAEVSNFLVDSV